MKLELNFDIEALQIKFRDYELKYRLFFFSDIDRACTVIAEDYIIWTPQLSGTSAKVPPDGRFDLWAPGGKYHKGLGTTPTITPTRPPTRTPRYGDVTYIHFSYGNQQMIYLPINREYKRT